MATGLGDADGAATGETAGEGARLWRTAGDGLAETLSGEGLAAGFADAGALTGVDVVGPEGAGGA